MGSRVGVSVYGSFPNGTFPGLVAIGHAAEAAHFQVVWHEDNVHPHTEALGDDTPMLECWTALAGLGAVTSRVRIGSLVTPAPRRHPALLAKMVSTVDRICDGRLVVGMGGGDPTTVDSYDSWGLPFPDSGRERVERLVEHLAVQKLMYQESRSSYAGQHFAIRDAVNSPKPVQTPHPPLWVGLSTRAKAMARVAAEHADGVVIEWGDDQVAARVPKRLKEACEALGRDPSTMTCARHTMAIVTPAGMSSDEAFKLAAGVTGYDDPADARRWWEHWMGVSVGSPQAVAADLLEKTSALGFDHVALRLLGVGFEAGPSLQEHVPETQSVVAGIAALGEVLDIEGCLAIS